VAIEIEFLNDVKSRFQDGFTGIERAVRQLDDEQLWRRPSTQSNSVGIILQHLTGNLNQWVLEALGGREYKRNRPLEFEDNRQKSKQEVVDSFVQLGKDIRDVVSAISPESLLEARQIQGTDQTVFTALVSAVTHLDLHAGQILYIAKMYLNEKYLPVSGH
jgi:3-methyladenine DNA glycosylase/8-oxoguanine DNA glycosylase